MTEAAEKRAVPWGKIVRSLASVAIVVVVLTRVPLHDLAARFKQMDAGDVGLLLLTSLLQMSSGAVRWWRLLTRLGARVSMAAVWRDLLVGALFNTFLPTAMGGDVVRALRMGKRLEHAHQAWSTSFYERLVGLLTLAVVGVFAAVFAVGSVLPARARIAVVAVTLVLGVLFFFASTPLRIVVRILEKRLPATFITDMRGVIADLEGPLTSGALRVETFFWTLIGFGTGIAFSYVGANALGAPGHLLAILVGIPIISILSMAPVSLGGHGLREGLFVVVLNMFGVPKDAALGIALFSLANLIMFALAGGVVAVLEPTARR